MFQRVLAGERNPGADDCLDRDRVTAMLFSIVEGGQICLPFMESPIARLHRSVFCFVVESVSKGHVSISLLMERFRSFPFHPANSFDSGTINEPIEKRGPF